MAQALTESRAAKEEEQRTADAARTRSAGDAAQQRRAKKRSAVKIGEDTDTISRHKLQTFPKTAEEAVWIRQNLLQLPSCHTLDEDALTHVVESVRPLSLAPGSYLSPAAYESQLFMLQRGTLDLTIDTPGEGSSKSQIEVCHSLLALLFCSLFLSSWLTYTLGPRYCLPLLYYIGRIRCAGFLWCLSGREIQYTCSCKKYQTSIMSGVCIHRMCRLVLR